MTNYASIAVTPSVNMNARIVVYGNSGAGKTTLARRFERENGLPFLDLDTIAWGTDWGRRAPLETSISRLLEFIESNAGWIVEGCYSDLIEAAIPHCTELHFLNPGIERCVANCRNRFEDWQKHHRAEDERSPLGELLPWVQDYENRNDEFLLARHRAIFNSFTGNKTEHV